jgi:hypothetical protein
MVEEAVSCRELQATSKKSLNVLKYIFYVSKACSLQLVAYGLKLPARSA